MLIFPCIHCTTCISLCSDLLAIGGRHAFDSVEGSKAIYAYKSTTNSWKVIDNNISMPHFNCFAVTLPTTNEIMVVGG